MEPSSAGVVSFRVKGVEVEITPEPTPEERAAIVAAVEQLQADEDHCPGAWWETGLRENVGEESGCA